MTDSLTRKGESKAALTKRLKSLPPGKEMSERVGPEDVPRWVKVAMAKVDILGDTYKDAAAEFGKSGSTLKNYNTSPFVKSWRASLQEIAEDPVQVAGLILKGSVLEAALDQLWAIEAAKKDMDYKEVRLGTRDILQSQNLLQTQYGGKRSSAEPIVINITLPGAEVKPLAIETDYEVIDAEIDDDTD
jgi:hypothetical protein